MLPLNWLLKPVSLVNATSAPNSEKNSVKFRQQSPISTSGNGRLEFVVFKQQLCQFGHLAHGCRELVTRKLLTNNYLLEVRHLNHNPLDSAMLTMTMNRFLKGNQKHARNKKKSTRKNQYTNGQCPSAQRVVFTQRKSSQC